jgi:hypothetical protein
VTHTLLNAWVDRTDEREALPAAVPAAAVPLALEERPQGIEAGH